MCGDVTIFTGVVTLPTTRWMWEVVSIWGGACQETLSYDEQERIDNAREKVLHYTRIQWAKIKIRQQKILEKENLETARLKQREGELMNMKPPLPPPPPKWMWEIASIYKWPPPPQPSEEEEQKIAVGREKALALIKEQWVEVKEK
jgi:hypothetical protein